MSAIEKDISKFYKKPIPNDITFAEMERVARHFGCIVQKSKGKHPYKVLYPEYGKVIPIPVHGKTVQEAYIKQLKDLFDRIREDENSEVRV